MMVLVKDLRIALTDRRRSLSSEAVSRTHLKF